MSSNTVEEASAPPLDRNFYSKDGRAIAPAGGEYVAEQEESVEWPAIRFGPVVEQPRVIDLRPPGPPPASDETIRRLDLSMRERFGKSLSELVDHSVLPAFILDDHQHKVDETQAEADPGAKPS